jgi:transposase
LAGGIGSKLLAKKYGIGSHQTILDWVNRYKEYGGSAFDVRSPKYDYDGNFKLQVLKWMKSNRASLTETALHFDISTPSTVWTWQRKFEKGGVEALFRRRGRSKQMTTSPNHKQGKKEEPSDLLRTTA